MSGRAHKLHITHIDCFEIFYSAQMREHQNKDQYIIPWYLEDLYFIKRKHNFHSLRVEKPGKNIQADILVYFGLITFA